MFDSIVISSGAEVGGVQSYAESLRDGFIELGFECKIASPKNVVRDIEALRSERILKILSTTACFAAPIARSSICVAHGFPRADAQGYLVAEGVKLSLKLAKSSSILIAVSEYVRTHLEACYGITCDGVIRSALNPLFLSKPSQGDYPRRKITFVGRLHPVKNVEAFLPSLLKIISETDFELHIIGDGPSKKNICNLIGNSKDVFIRGNLTHDAILTELRQSAVFFSGCTTEALGLSYLEALSQGCSIVMPSSGGGIEIAPQLIGKKIFLLRPDASIDEGCEVFRAALSANDVGDASVNLGEFEPKRVAEKYLDIFNVASKSKLRSKGLRLR